MNTVNQITQTRAGQTMAKDEILQLVGFRLADEEFGLNILNVQEINRLMSITHVPETPAFVDGIVNLRGQVVPVINMRRRLGIHDDKKDQDPRIVVVNVCGKVLGLLVDSVSEVIRIPSSTIEPAPRLSNEGGREYISGIGKLNDRLLILLDLDKMFSDTELESLKN